MIRIKSLKECLEENLVIKSTNYSGYSFNTRIDPGLEYSMLKMFGNVYFKYTMNESHTEYLITDENNYHWYWPKEVICGAVINFKNIKII
jgi:hypothetical protein